MNTLAELAAGGHDFAPPGSGLTADRLLFLADLACSGDVSTARLAEAHLDALAIVRESGHQPRPGRLYAVWASESGNEPRIDDGKLVGVKRFCSGLGIVDRALVTVHSADGEQLVDVNVSSLVAPTTPWTSPALRDTATGDANLDGITDFEVIATADWYLDRPGFWHGACGPAACWAGAAWGLIDAAVALCDDDPHRRAQTGALVSTRWALAALLRQAGDEIDADPADRNTAELRARALRHTVERVCSDVADRFSRTFGPRPFVADEAIAQRFADLHLYLRQHHGERELAAIAALAIRSVA